MAFSNEDLKQLKDKEHFNHESDCMIEFPVTRLRAFVIRLEAAENLLSLWMEAHEDTEIDGSVFDAAMATWRKSKSEDVDRCPICGAITKWGIADTGDGCLVCYRAKRLDSPETAYDLRKKLKP